MNAETNELSVLPRGRHPLVALSGQGLAENATRRVTKKDCRNLLTDHPLTVLNWLAESKPYMPRQKIRYPLDETTGPLISNALVQALRISIRDLKPTEAVDRILKFQAVPKNRPTILVLVMAPCEKKIQSAWDLYYRAIRHWMNYLAEGDTRDVRLESQRTIFFWGRRRRLNRVATSHRAEAKIYLRVAIKEMIRLSPQVLRIGELAYILSELVGVLNGLRAGE